MKWDETIGFIKKKFTTEKSSDDKKKFGIILYPTETGKWFSTQHVENKKNTKKKFGQNYNLNFESVANKCTSDDDFQHESKTHNYRPCI